MQIEFKGKQIDVTEVEPGVVRKGTSSTFYLFDNASQEWKYCAQERLNALRAKGTDFATYSSRKGGSPKAKSGEPKKKFVDPIRKELEERGEKTGSGLWVCPEMRDEDYEANGGNTLFDRKGASFVNQA